MKLGLDTFSYRYAAGLWEYTPRQNAPMTVDHFLQKALELDLDGVHVSDARHLESLEYGYASSLRAKAESLGLYLELGTAGTNPDHLQSMVRTAHVLGSDVVSTFVGKPRPRSARGMQEILDGAADEIAQVVPVCQRYGVSLAIENHRDLMTVELLSVLRRIDSEWVGVGFDTGNPLALLEDPLEAAGELAGFIRRVRLKDYQVTARADGFTLVGCALGEGVVDLRGILDLVSAEAPKAGLRVATCVEKHVVPALEEAYLAELPAASARALGRTLRLVRDCGQPGLPPSALERGAPEDEVLSEEDELVARSARWAQRALGRGGEESLDSGD